MKKSHASIFTLIVSGAVLWNSWIFGWLNHGSAGYLGMSISELEVRGQPHFQLFHYFELISGILLAIGGLALLYKIINRRLGLLAFIAIAISVVGLLTLFDTTHPLDCNGYNNPACAAKVDSNMVSHTDMLHNDESRITAWITFFLAIAITAWVYRAETTMFNKLVIFISFAGIITSLIILDLSGRTVIAAIAERVWNVLVSVDIALVAYIFTVQITCNPEIIKRYHRPA